LKPLQRVVTTPAGLASLGAHLQEQDAIGLDTEFLRERTYRPELCLVQLSTSAQAACVDPLALGDLSPLAPVLGNPRPVKVMHASRQDLEVLFPAFGLVRGVFDTQIAAALTGLPPQIGYADLVRRVLGRELPKSHTRTDWSRRPLSPEQIEYALDDVRYLLPLKTHLEEQLDRLGRLAWLEEELGELTDVRLATDPEEAWLRVKGLRSLDPDRTRLARELAAWRERRAIERNRPRGWIIEDAVLREIVLRVPRTMQALSAIPGIPAGLLKHCSEDILAIVHAARIPDPPPPPPSPRQRPDPEKQALVRKLSGVNQAIATDLGLSPEILATRRDLEQLVEGRRELPILRGWRRGIVGERLLAAL